MTRPDFVLVPVDDLLAVLSVVPSWVPEGWHGDHAWTSESLAAKDRLTEILDAYLVRS